MVRFVDKYTEEIANTDFFVFLKTPWVEQVYDEKLGRKVWRRSDDNFVYALRPNSKVRGSKSACEAYSLWAGKLQTIWNTVLDSITQDEPLNLEDALDSDTPEVIAEKEDDFAEYDALVFALTEAGILTSGSVIVEDAGSWQKDKATQKWKRELKELQAEAIDFGDKRGRVA